MRNGSCVCSLPVAVKIYYYSILKLVLDERLAKHKKARYYDLCKDFETKYKMSSDIFMQKFESGHLDDLDDYFDWYAAKKGLNHWNKKLNILSCISL